MINAINTGQTANFRPVQKNGQSFGAKNITIRMPDSVEKIYKDSADTVEPLIGGGLASIAGSGSMLGIGFFNAISSSPNLGLVATAAVFSGILTGAGKFIYSLVKKDATEMATKLKEQGVDKEIRISTVKRLLSNYGFSIWNSRKDLEKIANGEMTDTRFLGLKVKI